MTASPSPCRHAALALSVRQEFGCYGPLRRVSLVE